MSTSSALDQKKKQWVGRNVRRQVRGSSGIIGARNTLLQSSSFKFKHATRVHDRVLCQLLTCLP